MTTAAKPDPLALILRKLDELTDQPRLTPRFLSIIAAAAYYSLSEKSFRRLISSGKLTAYRPVGKVLLDTREIDQLVLSSTQRPTGGRGSGLAKWREEEGVGA